MESSSLIFMLFFHSLLLENYIEVNDFFPEWQLNIDWCENYGLYMGCIMGSLSYPHYTQVAITELIGDLLCMRWCWTGRIRQFSWITENSRSLYLRRHTRLTLICNEHCQIFCVTVHHIVEGKTANIPCI